MDGMQAIPVSEPVLDFREIRGAPLGMVGMIKIDCVDVMRALKLKESVISHYKPSTPLFKLFPKDCAQVKPADGMATKSANLLPTSVNSTEIEKELDDLLS